MPESTLIHSTFVIERSFPKPPSTVFAAFSDPAKKRRWFADSATHTVETFEIDFRPGGVERTRYRMGDNTPFPGVPLTNYGVYQNIVPDRRIVFAYNMSMGDHPISASLLTIELFETPQGTDLRCTHQGVYFENSDGPGGRERGWNSLFDNLAEELK